MRSPRLPAPTPGRSRGACAIRSRLGDILFQAKRVTSSQLELALEMQRQRGGFLGEVLVGMGMLDRETLDAALALQAGRTPAC